MLQSKFLSSEVKCSVADSIVALHMDMGDIRDYHEFPGALEFHLKNLFPVDWLGLYVFGQGSKSYNVITSPSKHFDWSEKYAEFFHLDKIRIDGLNEDVGKTLIFDPHDNSRTEEEVYFFETVKKYTDASNFLILHSAKTLYFDSAICLYRSEEAHQFSAHEKQILDYLSPILVSFMHNMMLYSEFDFKRVPVDNLCSAQKALTLTLNDCLEPVDIPKETELFIKRHFPLTGRQFIPEPIDQWIRRQVAPKGHLEPNSGPWVFNICLPELDLHCKAHTVFTELRQLVLLVMMIPHNRPEDFSILESRGFTKREVETLSYLPLGYTNKQIAMAMDIQEITVKKHLKNTAQKLDTTGRTSTLYEAMKKRELISFLEI